MDTAKTSYPPQATGSDATALGDMESSPNHLRRDEGTEATRDRDAEVEAVTDAVVAAADAAHVQWVAQDKHRSNTVGHQKKQRQKVVDFGTVSKSSSVSVKTRTGIQGLFTQAVSDKSPGPEGALEGLKQALQSYAVPADLTWKWADGGSAHALEDNWTELVHSHWMMSKTQRHQQEALWEFLNTELAYINKITIITDLVMAALSNLHQYGYLQEVTPERLFSNLPSILAAHQRFWEEVMRPMLLRARQTGRPLDPLMLQPGCLKFQEHFPAYFQYCLEEKRALEVCRSQTETNPYFAAFVTWVETHPQCSRMRLGDMQAKPHQRITKYPLLLKAILKATEDTETQGSLKRMLTSVNDFVDSINNHLKQRDEQQALSQCAQRIEGYDIGEGMNEEIIKHVKEFHFDLMRPVRGVGPEVIRKLLLEDTVKIRGRKDSKVEAVLLLFTDVVLVAKGQRKSEKLKLVRPPLALDRMRCSALKDGSSFILVEVSDLSCPVSFYAFSTSSPENCTAWLSALQNAQETLSLLRETKTSTGPEVAEVDSLDSDVIAEVQLEQTEANPGPSLDNIAVNPTESQLEERSVTPHQQPTEEVTSAAGNADPAPLAKQRKFSDTRSQSVHGNLGHTTVRSGRSTPHEGMLSQPGSRKNSATQPWDVTEIFVPGLQERRVTWGQAQRPITATNPNPQHGSSSRRESLIVERPSNPHALLVGGYTQETSVPRESAAETFAVITEHVEPCVSQLVKSPHGSVKSNQSEQSEENQPRRDSWFSQSGEEEEEALVEAKRFSRKLKSPRVRRRRPMNQEADAPPDQQLQQELAAAGPTLKPRRANYSSNSDSDSSHRRPGRPGQGSHHRVLKMSSVKQNRGAFWNVDERNGASAELNTFSDPELPQRPLRERSPKLPVKNHRSSSIPAVVIQEAPVWPPAKKPSRPPPSPSPPPSEYQLKDSPLQGILDRAREREKERGAVRKEDTEKKEDLVKKEDAVRKDDSDKKDDPDKKDGPVKKDTLVKMDDPLNNHTLVKGNDSIKEKPAAQWEEAPPSSSHSSSPSPLPSDGDREEDVDEGVQTGYLQTEMFYGWREGNVDGSDDEEEKVKRKSSPMYPEGASVDWPGWCFDDEEIVNFMAPNVGQDWGDLDKTLTSMDFSHKLTQEEGQCSEV
ncbi:pleckstrin homology domain-containing family G member 6 isoform X2 [Engraulis encrasicolus]|uniref:pleckstrin homology domain-containing family G member 6 isoform X2 n=1 Tax=Engraulis encrasicolus TaxID=184585 RepID=UPI002FD0906C